MADPDDGEKTLVAASWCYYPNCCILRDSNTVHFRMLRMELKHQSPKCALNEYPHPAVHLQAGCKHSPNLRKKLAKSKQGSAGGLSEEAAQVVDHNPSIVKSFVVTLLLVDCVAPHLTNYVRNVFS
jgi:hypothetical protein